MCKHRLHSPDCFAWHMQVTTGSHHDRAHRDYLRRCCPRKVIVILLCVFALGGLGSTVKPQLWLRRFFGTSHAIPRTTPSCL